MDGAGGGLFWIAEEGGGIFLIGGDGEDDEDEESEEGCVEGFLTDCLEVVEVGFIGMGDGLTGRLGLLGCAAESSSEDEHSEEELSLALVAIDSLGRVLGLDIGGGF